MYTNIQIRDSEIPSLTWLVRFAYNQLLKTELEVGVFP